MATNHSNHFENNAPVLVQVPDNVEALLLKETDDTIVTAGTIESQTLVNEESGSVVSELSDTGFSSSQLIVHKWDIQKHYSDLVYEGLQASRRTTSNVVMLFESPSSSCKETNFFNGQAFRFHDYPPAAPVFKTLLAPCRYSMMNGSKYPSYLQCGVPPEGLVEHWKKSIPDFIEPKFVSKISDDDTVYAYLPVEHISKHLNDPYVHYHVSGKDALHLMTQHTPKLLNNTQDVRPCICKTTHSMGSRGIFVIHNDEDEQEFEEFLAESGNPPFVVTEYVEIDRNVACHFFIHPNCEEITWIGSNENRRNADGSWSSDSTIVMKDQDYLRDIQLPFVKDVVKYLLSLGFWGFCGIDILFDKEGKGYLVDVNPRCTGSSPAILCATRLHQKYGFEQCLYRRTKYVYPGNAKSLLQRVDEYNEQNIGKSMIVLSSFFEENEDCTLVQLGVFGGKSLDECEAVLNQFTVLHSQLAK